MERFTFNGRRYMLAPNGVLFERVGGRWTLGGSTLPYGMTFASVDEAVAALGAR